MFSVEVHTLFLKKKKNQNQNQVLSMPQPIKQKGIKHLLRENC